MPLFWSRTEAQTFTKLLKFPIALFLLQDFGFFVFIIIAKKSVLEPTQKIKVFLINYKYFENDFISNRGKIDKD